MQRDPYIRSSVVISVWNGAATLERALLSVEEQTTAIDEVVKVIESWKKRLPIVLIENGINLGIIKSLRIGVSQSTGDLIFRLDADDAWFPRHVASIMEAKRKYPRSVLFSGRAVVLRHDSEVIRYSSEVFDRSVRAKLMWDNPLVHSCLAFDRIAYDSVGGYREPKYAEDYDLWIRLLTFGAVVGQHHPTMAYYELPNSASRIKRSPALAVRFDMQVKAIRAFARRHPFTAARILPVVMLRHFLNRWRAN
jgi:glycosyltransferase involved in cell wall biosynthesis